MNRVLIACLIAFGFAAPAEAWWSKGRMPACDSPNVIASVKKKFAYADRRQFHWGVAINQVTDIYETPEIIENSSLIGRRFCRGTAWLTDGRREEVVYLVETKQGFASVTWHVKSCLPRFDPWHVYGAWCRSIEP